MKFNPYIKDSILISKIGLGAWQLGHDSGWKSMTKTEAVHLVHSALDVGVNFFDTAELYPVPPRKEEQGDTEKFIGTWFKKTGNRKNVILASKIDNISLF